MCLLICPAIWCQNNNPSGSTMHLAHYGLISIDGTAQRPEPGADFAAYQKILTNARAMMAMKKRIEEGRKRAQQYRHKMKAPRS